jgi:hypothetical protein
MLLEPCEEFNYSIIIIIIIIIITVFILFHLLMHYILSINRDQIMSLRNTITIILTIINIIVIWIYSINQT